MGAAEQSLTAEGERGELVLLGIWLLSLLCCTES